MAEKTNQEQEPGILQTLGSLQFGIVVLVALTVVAVAGTIIPQGQPYEFYADHYSGPVTALIRMFNINNTYRSALFMGLLGLFGLNLVLCSLMKFPALLRATLNPDRAPGISRLAAMPIYTRRSGTSIEDVQAAFAARGYRLVTAGDDRLFGEKGRLGRFGASTVHLSLLVLLIGGVTSLLTGVRGQIVLHPGETTGVAAIRNQETMPLGFEITLDRFDVSFYEEHPGRPQSYSSKVTVATPDGVSFDRDVRVNHPIMMNHMTVYQSSYGLMTDTDGGVAAADDTARVAVRLNGAPEDMPPVTTAGLTVGGQMTVPGFGDSITVGLTELYRDFQGMGGRSGEPNPAARFDIATTGGRRWSVYAFSRFPGMNMPMDPDRPIMLDLLDITGGATEAAVDAEPEYYTVLGVVRDRGVPLVWIGSLIMMVGLVLSFYIRPRRIWVLAEGDVMHVAAMVKGDPAGFREFVMKTAPGKRMKS